mmetsp:Transcript_43043/g.135863  ORF Transcript_43043/g.135863 Transcript_43043/m.135863 type:complete len:944 (-) Transcript_43043:901-3732(-)
MPTMATKDATPAFSLTYYGEEHKHPLTITRSDLHFEAIPSQRLCLITLRLTVVNDAIAQDIESALRFPLPDSDATICGFQLGEDTAVSLPKTKAAEVAYKEREKGRAVATAASVQGAVYETTLFPLKYNEPKELTLTCFTALKGQADGTLALTLPLTFALPVPHVTIRANALDGALTIEAAGALPQTGATAAEARLAAASLPGGVTLRAVPAAGAPQVVSAASGERLYFTGCVSKEEIDSALSSPSTPRGSPPGTACGAPHVGLFVDCSLSAAGRAQHALALLDALDAAHGKLGGGCVYTLWSFSRVATRRTARGASFAETKAALAALRYDGGTDLRLLDSLIAEAASADEHGPACSAAVLVSDALDNLKAAPKLTGPGSAELPLHVALPPEACNANLSVLRWIARQLGSACAPLSEPDELAALVSGATTQVLLTRLQTDQRDDVAAFEDDAFQTCPDFRLSHVAVPTDADGSLRVSGVSVLGDSARDAPTALGLTVSRGGLRANIELAIPPPPAALESSGPLGRLLQVQHTLLTLRELRATFWDPKQVDVLATAAACDAGIASEHSSLLLISLPEQFCDNEIACPPDHPAHARWLALSAKRAKTKAEREEAEAKAKHAKLHGLVKQLVGRYKEMSDAAVPGSGKPVRGGRGTEEAMMLGGGGGGDRHGSAARGCALRRCAMPAAASEAATARPPQRLLRRTAAEASAEGGLDDECDLLGCDLFGAPLPSPRAPPPAPPPGTSAPRPAACMGFLDATELAELADSDEESPVFRSVLSSVASLVGGAARCVSLGGIRVGGGPNASPAPPCPPPKNPKPMGDEPWLGAIAEAYASSGLGGAQVAFDEQLKSSPALVGKPSTYIQASECLHACGADAAACADVLFDVLETKLPDFQTCRVVRHNLAFVPPLARDGKTLAEVAVALISLHDHHVFAGGVSPPLARPA